jgi:soluble lytic murein transglycosylase-like protein
MQEGEGAMAPNGNKDRHSSTNGDEPRRDRRAGDQPRDGGTSGKGGATRQAGAASATGKRMGRGPGDVFRRFRQPLIGLGLAGMAVPMVQATNAQQRSADAEPDVEPAPLAQDETAAAAPAGDVEDQLAERIGTSQADASRERQVASAMDQYNISRDLAEDIYDIARESNIEPRLAYGLVKTESTFNERAVSPVGARGLTQVMPRTAAWLVPGTKTQDLYDRQTNLRLGFTYLDQMISKYKGNVRLALLAYNRGPGTVDRVLKQGGNPDNGYADKVLRG